MGKKYLITFLYHERNCLNVIYDVVSIMLQHFDEFCRKMTQEQKL